MNNTDRTHFSKRKEKALRLLADIEEAGPFGRPIVVKTPFKLDYLSARLVREGWKIERSPATRCPWIVKVALSMRRRTLQIPLLSNCPWIVRVALLMRRGKLQLPIPSNGWRLKLPTRRDWRDLAMMHHAVLSPPSYPSVEITPSAARLLRD